MDVLIFIPTLAAILVPIVLIGRWILGPIDRAAKHRQAPVRFSIGDFLCLFLAVQIPLTAAYQLVDEDTREHFWAFSILSWVIAPAIWWACARTLSKAGISSGLDRFVFLGLVMPVVYYGLVPFIMLTVMFAVTILVGQINGAAPYMLWLALAWLLLASLFFVCGLLTRWIMGRSRFGKGESNLAGERLASLDSALPLALTGGSHRQDDAAVG